MGCWFDYDSDDLRILVDHGCIESVGPGDEFICLTRKSYELASKVYDRMSKNPLTASEQLMLAAILM